MNGNPARSLEFNLRVFETLVRTGHSHLRRGSTNGALFYGTVAASWASVNHTGLFASAELEALCTRLAETLEQVTPAGRRPADGIRRVLHVLSETAEVGGHTRFVRRWIENDRGRSHSVVLARQAVEAVPQDLAEAVRATGGGLRDLLGSRDPISRAVQLRTLAGEFDCIDACVHGDDLIPAVAFADPHRRPPLIWLDHQDHKFWVGVAAADLVVELSDVGRATARDRRGVSFLRSALLPIPLQLPQATPKKAEAREALGLPADGVVLLTVASPYKFRGTVRPRFAEAALEILRERDSAILVAVGPTPESDDAWAKLATAYPDRANVLGPRPDPFPYYAAADAYLDSYPCGGHTAALEAGSHGLPIVSRRTALEGPDLLAVDDPALRDTLVACADAAAWREAVLRLVDEPQLRSDLGKLTAERIASAHADRWSSFLEPIYEEAIAQHGQREFSPRPPGPRSEAIDLSLARAMEAWGWTRHLRDTLGHYLQLLDSDPLLLQLVLASIQRYEQRGHWSRSSEEQLLDDQAGGGVLSIIRDPAGGPDSVLRCAPAGESVVADFQIDHTAALVHCGDVLLASPPASGVFVVRVGTTSGESNRALIAIGASQTISARAGGRNSFVKGPKLELGRWYRIDFVYDVSAHNHTLDWQVDGVPQIKARYDAGVAGDIVTVGLGYEGSGSSGVCYFNYVSTPGDPGSENAKTS